MSLKGSSAPSPQPDSGSHAPSPGAPDTSDPSTAWRAPEADGDTGDDAWDARRERRAEKAAEVAAKDTDAAPGAPRPGDAPADPGLADPYATPYDDTAAFTSPLPDDEVGGFGPASSAFGAGEAHPRRHPDDLDTGQPPVSPEAGTGVMTGAPAPEAGIAPPHPDDEVSGADARPLRWDEATTPVQPGIDDTVYAPPLSGNDAGYAPPPPWSEPGAPYAPAGGAAPAAAPGWDPSGPAGPALPPPGARPRSRPLRVVAVGAAAAILSVVVAGAIADSALGADRTARRLRLASSDVGGLTEDELRGVVDRLAEDIATRPVSLRTAQVERSVPSSALGLSLDRVAVVDAARAVGHDGPALLRPLWTVRSWFFGEDVPLRFSVDRDEAARGASEAAGEAERPPTEPGVALQGDAFVVTPGTDGELIDGDGLTERLHEMAADSPNGPWAIDVPVRPVAPQFSIDDARRLADRANSIGRSALTVTAGGKRTTVPPQKVRAWLRTAPVEGRLELQADIEAVLKDVTAAVGKVGTEPTEATFKVNGDKVDVTPGKPGMKCCAPDSGTRVAEALLAGKTSVALDLVEDPAKLDEAGVAKLGIKEKVATFTTRHPGGQPRVANIHRAADALRGAIVEPGGTFSLNQRLGPRTEAKGYVNAGVINRGVFEESVGGGISQLTTTLFNAVFFAGLDFKTYQAHTIYIDRYPYGREAPISWPAPDLSFRNQSPHGVLIWTSYDDTSITVSLYSTKWVTAEQTNQTKEPSGLCTRVRTERTRTYVKDGRKDQTYVTATYQPEEGTLCDGTKVEKTTTTTAPKPAPPPAPAAPPADAQAPVS